MAEQTVQEKLEELHRCQVEMLERRIKEQEEQYHLALEREREANQEQRKAAGEYVRERVQELTKQNDGMLGAIGRLHGENENLRKALEQAEKTARERLEQIERNEHQLQVELERWKMEMMEREKKGKEDLYKVTQENLELRRRLGEKIPNDSSGKPKKKGKK